MGERFERPPDLVVSFPRFHPSALLHLRASDSGVRRRPKPPDAVHITSEVTHTLKGVGSPVPDHVAAMCGGVSERTFVFSSEHPVVHKGVGSVAARAARNRPAPFTLLSMAGTNIRPSNRPRFAGESHPRRRLARLDGDRSETRSDGGNSTRRMSHGRRPAGHPIRRVSGRTG